MFLLVVLASIVAVVSTSAEDVKLTTIIPDQSSVRGVRGAIGRTYKTATEANMGDDNFFIEGYLCVGNNNPQVDSAHPSPSTGNINANDIYLRKIGAWASAGANGLPSTGIYMKVGTQSYVATAVTTTFYLYCNNPATEMAIAGGVYRNYEWDDVTPTEGSAPVTNASGQFIDSSGTVFDHPVGFKHSVYRSHSATYWITCVKLTDH